MTLIQSCKYRHKKCSFKDFSKSSPPPKSNYDKFQLNSLIVDHIIGPSRSSITKYTKENLQKIFRIILEA